MKTLKTHIDTHLHQICRCCFLINLVLLVGCSGTASKSATEPKATTYFNLEDLMTIDQVGASALPEDIVKVSAPFEMKDFKKPTFPDLKLQITEMGAIENTMITKTIQDAIDTVNRQGGGTVIIPKGQWKSGRIHLKSNVNLHLEEGAELYFSGQLEDYRPAVFTRHEGVEVMSLGACIYAYQQSNIAITGKGTLYGPEEGPVKEQMMTEDVTENFVPVDKPVEERLYEGYNGESIFLPMFISPTDCKDVYIEGVTLERTAFWNIVPVYCDGVIIRGVTVNSVGISRGDGIDVESSRNVLIEYCTLNTGDDCFTMKAGRGIDGIRVNKPTENVVVRYCLAKQGHGGITVGSETAGVIKNLYVHDCVFENTGVGIRFKTRRPRGGGAQNLYYERLRMNLNMTAFRWDLLGQRKYVGKLADRLPMRTPDELTPNFNNIIIKDILVENASTFLNINGIPEIPLNEVLLENVVVKNCKKLFNADDVTNLRLEHVEVTSQDSIVRFLDAQKVTFKDVNFKSSSGAEIQVIKKGPNTKNVIFEDVSWEPTKTN